MPTERTIITGNYLSPRSLRISHHRMFRKGWTSTMVAFYFSLTPIPKAERVAIFQKSLSTTCPVNSGDFCKRHLNVLNLGSRLFRVYIFPIGTRGDTCEILSDVRREAWTALGFPPLSFCKWHETLQGQQGFHSLWQDSLPPPLPAW